MALGFNTESKSAGDILPIIKYDAKAGDLIAVNRVQGEDGQWTKNEAEVKMPTNFVMDMENIEVGWLSFATGAPDFVMAKVGEPMPGKPSEDHKQAFRLRIASTDLGLREFSHSAKTVLRCMDDLHSKYLAEKGQHAGLMPVVAIEGTETIKIQSPNGELRFKAPKWSIVSWVDKPDFFGAASEPVTTPEPVAAQDSGDEAPLF